MPAPTCADVPTMPIRLGNKAEGADFFDRKTEREALWRHLEGNHVVVSGPRRLGKTSVLQRLAEEAPARGLLGRLVDLEGLDTPAAFIRALDGAFPDATVSGHTRGAAGAMGGWLARLRKIDVKLPGGMGGGIGLQDPPDADWAGDAARLQQRLTAAPVLLLLDEVSVFLEKALARDAADTVRLLAWLRAWRQQSGLVCRFVFSGSIGLNALLDRHGLVTYFNDCFDFRLGPFTEPAALQMLATECAREGWTATEETLRHLCARVGWLSPFYLNLLLDSAIAAARDRRQETGDPEQRVQESDIDDGFDRLLAVRSRFIHWYRRLQRDLDPADLPLALRVLAAVAKPADGLTRRQILARLAKLEPDPDRRAARLDAVMIVLEEDGYLSPADDRIRFPSFILREYWRRNHAR
jgi:uncharacterized protein